MAYTKCPAGCGKKFITKEYAERHADEDHKDWRIPKQRGWATPHGFVDFREPVTYEQACATAQKISENMRGKL
jgi:hypothetical protein